MTDALVLVGRRTSRSETVLETHARRLRERGVTDRVAVVQYEQEPKRTVVDAVADLDASSSFVVPLVIDREHFPTSAVSAATPDEVHVADPVGNSPAVADAVLERATQASEVPSKTSVVLAGLGRGSDGRSERAVEYHADRLRRTTDFEQVRTGYLAADPSLECVAYELTGEETVVVPVFVAADEATRRRVRDRLGADAATTTQTDPLGTTEWLTSAVQAELARLQVLASAKRSRDSTAATGPSLVADGDGSRGRDA